MSSFAIPGASLLNQALALHRAGRFAQAVPLYEQVLRVAPRDARTLDLLGCAQNSLGMVDEGRRNIERAIKLLPNQASFHHDLSLTYKREGRFDPGHECLNKALRLAPRDPVFSAAKADLFFLAGEFDLCMRTLEPVLGRADDQPAVALMFGMVAARVKRAREAIEVLQRLVDRPTHGAAQREGHFTLGALHDGENDFDKAFDAYRRGNELVDARFDAAGHAQAIAATIASWRREVVATLPRAAVDGSRAVFIVGMPRSGTTLVEQILGVSPEVFPAGELDTMIRLARATAGCATSGMPLITDAGRLTVESLTTAATTYLDVLRRLSPSARFVLDKLPLNFLELGFIQQALPGAKVIHCRRDPMDSCLSCYFQLFSGNLPFAYDLDAVGRFYVEYERLMAHWRSVLTMPILDVQYEELVGNQEGVSRTLFDFVGVPWTDAALRFHESKRTSLTSSNTQVRQPVYTRSVARWRNYERHLGPLVQALKPLQAIPRAASERPDHI